MTDTPRRLPGTGHAWRVGGRGLKCIGSDASWLDWEERVLSSLDETGFRIQRPRRALGRMPDGLAAERYATLRWAVLALGDDRH